jgi:hypothetical protein
LPTTGHRANSPPTTLQLQTAEKQARADHRSTRDP